MFATRIFEAPIEWDEKYETDDLTVQKMKLLSREVFDPRSCTVFRSGKKSGTPECDTHFVVYKNFACNITDFKPINERIGIP